MSARLVLMLEGNRNKTIPFSLCVSLYCSLVTAMQLFDSTNLDGWLLHVGQVHSPLRAQALPLLVGEEKPSNVGS